MTYALEMIERSGTKGCRLKTWGRSGVYARHSHVARTVAQSVTKSGVCTPRLAVSGCVHRTLRKAVVSELYVLTTIADKMPIVHIITSLTHDQITDDFIRDTVKMVPGQVNKADGTSLDYETGRPGFDSGSYPNKSEHAPRRCTLRKGWWSMWILDRGSTWGGSFEPVLLFEISDIDTLEQEADREKYTKAFFDFLSEKLPTPSSELLTGARVIDREDNRRIRWIKEAVWIRKSTPVMNRDDGGIQAQPRLGLHSRRKSATYNGDKWRGVAELQSEALRKVSDRHRNVSR
ncbi:hypothetical protein Bbelb_100900 [Branchiostoma belcheri]|nr:hypothetical protein Bbelb_100900 [Branchiostoma belcheri]